MSSLSVIELQEFPSWLLLSKHANFVCFIENWIPDDTKDYQTKSYRERVKLKAVSCSAVIMQLAGTDGCLEAGRFGVLQGKPVILPVPRRQHSCCLAQECFGGYFRLDLHHSHPLPLAGQHVLHPRVLPRKEFKVFLETVVVVEGAVGFVFSWVHRVLQCLCSPVQMDLCIEAFGTSKQKRALSSRHMNAVGSDIVSAAVTKAAANVIDTKGVTGEGILSRPVIKTT